MTEGYETGESNSDLMGAAIRSQQRVKKLSTVVIYVHKSRKTKGRK